MGSYAFAAIEKIVEDEGITGPGQNIGGGTNIGDDEEEQEQELVFVLSGGAAYPFVPFTLSIDSGSDKYGGAGGNLLGCFSDETPMQWAYRTRGTWSNGSITHSLGVQTVDPSKIGCRFTWDAKSRGRGTTVVSYDTGRMVPDILDSSVAVGASFQATITYTGSGGKLNCYGAWSQFGADVWWEKKDGGEWARTSKARVVSSSWASGLRSMACKVDEAGSYRLCVSYAGKSEYAMVSATAATCAITGVDYLHTRGAEGTIRIELGDPSSEVSVSIEDLDGNAYTGIVDSATMAAPVFVFADGACEVSLLAVSSQGNAKIVVRSGGEVIASHGIAIDDGLVATFTAPSTVPIGVSFGFSMVLSGDNVATPRATKADLLYFFDESTPFGATVNGLFAAFEDENNWDGNEFSCTGLTISASEDCVLRIDALDLDMASIGYFTIDVVSARRALAEAISERLLAKDKTHLGPYTENDTANKLRTGAIFAVEEFIKGEIGSDGSFTKFNFDNHGISPASEADAWFAETYGIVCSATRQAGSWEGEGESREGYGETTRATRWDPDLEESVWAESEAAAIARAVSECESEYATVTPAGSYASPKASTYSYKNTDDPNEYMTGKIWVKKTFVRSKYKCISRSGKANFSRSAKWLFHASGPTGGTFAKHGHDIPGENQYGYMWTQNAGKNEDFGFTPWTANSLATVTDWEGTYKGYFLGYPQCFVEFGFKHK